MKHTFVLLKNAYGTEEMRKVWTEENMVQKWLDMEVAITKAKAEVGIITWEQANGIIEKSSVKYLTPQMIAEVKAGAAHLIVSFIKAFAKMCKPWGEWYHVGPTTQDILDTGLVLQLREAYTILMRQLRELEDALCDMAITHKDTVMMGRTHGQHAVPLTWGFKCAIWAGAVRDTITRFKELAPRLFQANISAAVGARNTFAYLVGPEKAEKIQDIVSRELGLYRPVMDIHQRPDRYAEFVNTIAECMMNLSQMSLEIRELQKTELQEVEEPFDSKEQYSSSTMPNKRNPEPSEWVRGLSACIRGAAQAVNEICMQHERDATRMAAEFGMIPEACLNFSAALKTCIFNMRGLRVKPENMRRNLYATKDIAMAELVLMGLYKKLGGQKVTAHTWVHDISMAAFDNGTTLREEIKKHPEASKLLTDEEIIELTNPETYVGTAPLQAVRMVEYIKQQRKLDQEALAEVAVTLE
ncbi:adenylosuccinate lyase [Thermanaerosceptrum fracticalcis]|uniref:Adenylosuccinate lyase n=1 Tax=Thermanaerosceptrum fracticalcis TaxID=1712410 RepID=A0A7G6E6C7_THEFR|nr:lyase family protein [Thermanaerosceptrum fracticalcis]QNB47631.1 adenylosuccinate lyase [Thermanaerosceptrum fracticalcis]